MPTGKVIDGELAGGWVGNRPGHEGVVLEEEKIEKFN